MSESKHTPGPWRVEYPSIVTSDVCIAVIEDDGGYEADSKTRQANADLIAAAPDLLKAARDVETLYAEMHAAMPIVVRNDAFDIVSNAVRKARAAIAKAEGRK